VCEAVVGHPDAGAPARVVATFLDHSRGDEARNKTAPTWSKSPPRSRGVRHAAQR
jgi:hypothetical protein